MRRRLRRSRGRTFTRSSRSAPNSARRWTSRSCRLLTDRGHPYSEIANESIIEAVDSLNPYMDYKGVSFMVDNCSTTARLGARKWASRFDYILTQLAYTAIDESRVDDETPFEAFERSDIHEVLAVCAELRPSVDIAVVPPRG